MQLDNIPVKRQRFQNPELLQSYTMRLLPTSLWQAGRQADRGTDRQTHRQTDRQAGRQTDRQAGRQIDGQTDKEADRQADRRTDRQTGRQAGRQVGRHPPKGTRQVKHKLLLCWSWSQTLCTDLQGDMTSPLCSQQLQVY